MIAPHLDALELLRAARADTLRLTRGLTQQQADFRPGSHTWSVGQVMDHLLIAEQICRDTVRDLIGLAKAGRRPVIRRSFSDVDTSIAYIPRSLLPFLDVPFTVLNLFVPSFVREAITEHRMLPTQNPTIAEPASSRPITELRDGLRDSFDDTSALIRMNPNLDFRAMRYKHPLLGDNHVPNLLRIAAFHEKRHHSQIREIMKARLYPRTV